METRLRRIKRTITENTSPATRVTVGLLWLAALALLILGCGAVESAGLPLSDAAMPLPDGQTGAGGSEAAGGSAGMVGTGGQPQATGGSAGLPNAGGSMGTAGTGGASSVCTIPPDFHCNQCPGGGSSQCVGGNCCSITPFGCDYQVRCQL